ncbi:MAG: D-alanyl-D-alanine carboxypeptidase family protein [Acutalibacteraceae bacterium]|nr:D-alanyl-D-alanine carboxypeptidase family protein [Acutalibacteraceae bacterium]
MKRIIALIFCFVFMCNIFVCAEKRIASECDISDIDVPLEASSNNAVIGQKLDIKAKSVILMEVNTGKILYEDNADEALPPASITKIMSLLLVMEAIDRGDFDLQTVISASEHACSMGGSQIWLEPGESMEVDSLLKAAVIASANDATVALGEAVAGSEEGFVALMNERAKELGMINTNFVNCTGLDAEGHLTSAHDVAIMSCELIKHDLIKDYSTVWMDTLRNGESELVNTNKLVRFYEGTTGLKTGTTSTAGYCLSATAQRNGMELAAVVMGGDTSNDRFGGAKKLLDYGFANYIFSKVDANLDKDIVVEIDKGTEKELTLDAKGTVNLLMKKNEAKEIIRKTVLNENITAPIKKGDVLGEVEIYLGDEVVGSIPLTASKDIDKLSFLTTLGWILKGLFIL